MPKQDLGGSCLRHSVFTYYKDCRAPTSCPRPGNVALRASILAHRSTTTQQTTCLRFDSLVRLARPPIVVSVFYRYHGPARPVSSDTPPVGFSSNTSPSSGETSFFASGRAPGATCRTIFEGSTLTLVARPKMHPQLQLFVKPTAWRTSLRENFRTLRPVKKSSSLSSMSTSPSYQRAMAETFGEGIY